MCANKLVLGTVQFGLPYGINQVKRPELGEIVSIVKAYSEVEEPLYDTAVLYGDSQKNLGKCFEVLKLHDPKVITKFSGNCTEGRTLREEIENSLKCLNIRKLYGVLAHRSESLLHHPFLRDELLILKEKNLVSKIGISAYYPSEIEVFLESGVPLDIVQVPYSCFDQRFKEILEDCKREFNTEIHIRSVFLQGLIFKPHNFFSSGYFSVFSDKIQQLHNLGNEFGVGVATVALSFALLEEIVDRVVIGVDSVKFLEENFRAIEWLGGLSHETKMRLYRELSGLAVGDEKKLLPFNWPRE